MVAFLSIGLSYMLRGVRLTVFWNKNTWNRSKKAFVFTEIHIKIVKQVLKCYFLLFLLQNARNVLSGTNCPITSFRGL